MHYSHLLAGFLFINMYVSLNAGNDTLIYQHGIIDWSDSCKQNATKTVFLTLGMGVSDAVIIVISEQSIHPNCVLKIFTVQNVYLIVVIEFPDKRMRKGDEKKACLDKSSRILVYDSNVTSTPQDICKTVNMDEEMFLTTYLTESGVATVAINSKTTFESIKVTATTARKLKKNEKCEELTEIRCLITDHNNDYVETCLSVEVQCDGHMNCGKWEQYDEDSRKCAATRYAMLWLVVIAAMIMTAIIVFFLVRLLRSCVPRVGTTSFFIFNEDEDNKLNLATMYTPATILTIPTSKTSGSILSHPSSYRFRTSSAFVSELSSEQEQPTSLKPDVGRREDSETELPVEPTASPQKSLARSRKDSFPTTIKEEGSKALDMPLPTQKTHQLKPYSPPLRSQPHEKPVTPPTQLKPQTEPFAAPKERRSTRKPRFLKDPEFIKTAQTSPKLPGEDSVVPKSILHGRATPLGYSEERSKSETEESEEPVPKIRRHSLASAKSSTLLLRRHLGTYPSEKRPGSDLTSKKDEDDKPSDMH